MQTLANINLTPEQICCILSMLERYENWDEASEMFGIDFEELDSALRAALEENAEACHH